MNLQKPENANATVIAVTATPTKIFDLMNTAGSTTSTNAGFIEGANSVLLTPEDGDIRILSNVDPSATKGFLVSQDVTVNLSSTNLNELRFIRVGGSDVAVSLLIGKETPEGAGVTTVTSAGGGGSASLTFDSGLSGDGESSGITTTGTAGATLAFGDLIYLDPTDSKWELADANAVAAADGDSRGMIGICVLAAAEDAATNILLQGIVRADAAFPTLTVNAQIYVSETAGDVVVTQPSTTDVVIRVLGFGLTANEMYFNPSSDFITAV